MIQPNIIFFIINSAGALLIIGASLPLAMRKVKMNDFYGIRSGKAFKSRDNWYSINAYGGKQLIAWSIPMLAAGLVSIFITFDNRPPELMAVLFGAGPITLCMSIAAWRICVFSKKL